MKNIFKHVAKIHFWELTKLLYHWKN